MKLKLVVLGMMGRSPFGGQTWLYLNWLNAIADNGSVPLITWTPSYWNAGGHRRVCS